MEALGEGNALCTFCNRCTGLCPAGIDLQAVWQATREQLAAAGFEGPLEQGREQAVAVSAREIAEAEDGGFPLWRPPDASSPILAGVKELVADCIQCQTCSNVCPVVGAANPASSYGLTPQQVLNLLRMGLTDTAAGVPLVWNCTGCYQCQEQCPRGIPVTDIFYALRNRACRSVITGGMRRAGSHSALTRFVGAPCPSERSEAEPVIHRPVSKET